MSKKVFANGREITAKKSSTQVSGAMPDVCLSPPGPPAGPLPVPYPNFSKAKDLAEGSKTVKIGGQPIALKNQSSFKTSTGDEAATRSFGMGLVTHTIQGKTYHKSWSFDVLVDGKNVVSHMDLTSHNHASDPSNGAVGINAGKMSLPQTSVKDECRAARRKNRDKREELTPTDASTEKHRTTTITHGVLYRDGQPPKRYWSASKALAGKYKNGMATGHDYSAGLERAATQRRNAAGHVISDVKGGAEGSHIKCGEQRGFKYRATASSSGQTPHTSHTESRIIEEIFKGSQGGRVTGTLLLAIDWPGGGDSQDRPCKHCKRLIYAAILCGLDVVLCRALRGPERLNLTRCPKDLG